MPAKILILLFITICLEEIVAHSTNDYTCTNNICTNVNYLIFKSGNTIKLNISLIGSCNNVICSQCVTKSNWTLVILNREYYMQRYTFQCYSESQTNSLPYTDIMCSNEICTKLKFQVYSIKWYLVLYAFYGTTCDPEYCRNCKLQGPWKLFDKILNNNFTRQTESCLALDKIRVIDFFNVDPEGIVSYSRNDITCTNNICTNVNYLIYKSGKSIKLYISLIGSCDNTICSQCVTKSNWKLVILNSEFYIQRYTFQCYSESQKNFLSETDIMCSNENCTKAKFHIVSIKGYTRYVSAYDGTSCDPEYCRNCKLQGPWTIPDQYYNTFRRQIESCLALDKIRVTDFFNVDPEFLTVDLFEWNIGRIFALIISCISFISILVILSILFCRRNN